MRDSKARSLLEKARVERDRARRHLLVAAALREVLAADPIVVGGVAEDFWAAGVYHETDLDLCAPLQAGDEGALRRLGFSRHGRHWFHDASQVAVEFPDSRIDGDEDRTVEAVVGDGRARIIGVDDLYLDRLRQATMNEGVENDIAFKGALAIAAARYEEMDWAYVRARIAAIVTSDRLVGESMRTINRRVRGRARRAARG